MTFDVEAVRKDFPILSREVHGVRWSTSTAPTPRRSRRRSSTRWPTSTRSHYANVARAVHTLGSEATNAFEGARDKVAAFLNAPRRDEMIFTKNITEALNLLAYSFSNASTFPGAERFRLGPGDEIVVTEMEHHSNLVPWQLLAQRTGATFRWIPLDDDGRLVESAHRRGHQPSAPRSSSFVHQSNALGTINPVQRIVDAGEGGRRADHRRRRAGRAAPAAGRPGRSAPTSSRSPVTSSTARPASACCGGATTCSPSCRRSWAAAR